MHIRPLIAAGVLCAASLLAVIPISGARSDEDDIQTNVKPGPTSISDEEKAIVADPARSIERGVILMEDFERNDARTGTLNARDGKGTTRYVQTAFHRRAKILSAEGRDLGKVEIELPYEDSNLVRWWGKTILPDGTALDLPRAALIERTIRRFGAVEVRSLQATLARIEPGSVVDFGWVVKSPKVKSQTSFTLQQDWPVRLSRFRWIPLRDTPTFCSPLGTRGLDVQVKMEWGTCLVIATGLPPAIREPLMPPEDEVLPSLRLAYVSETILREGFWDVLSKTIEEDVHRFTGSDRLMRKMLDQVQGQEPLDAPSSLRRIYEWITANVDVVRDPEAGVLKFKAYEESPSLGSANIVFQSKRGSPYQISLLYLALARAAGARANLVLASDRRKHDWDPNLPSWSQFEEPLVAVNVPGAPDDARTLVAPASGLGFEQIPWWVQGGRALVAEAPKPTTMNLSSSTAEENVSRVSGAVALGASGGTIQARWSHSGSGQIGYLEWRALSALAPEKRKPGLEEICNAGPDFEVSRAEAHGIDGPLASFGYECEGTLQKGGPGDAAGGAVVEVGGPWIEDLPDLSSTDRHYPLVFPFPRTEEASIVFASPPGFAPGKPPDPVSVEGPFGRYSLTVTGRPDGFHVRRELALSLAMVSQLHYSEFRDFVLQVKRADRTPLPFVRADEVKP